MKIDQEVIISSIKNALQHISYYHNNDFIQAMYQAYKRETHYAAKNALRQVLINSKMSAIGKRPICQDTGIVNVFIKIGNLVNINGNMDLEQIVNKAVSLSYLNKDNPLRASIVDDPIFKRINTKDNTPAVIYTKLVQGDFIEICLGAKGAGSENKAEFKSLEPGDNLMDWVLKTVPKLGAGWCPPGILGIGVGGTPEKSMLLAKESLFQPIDIHLIKEKPNKTKLELLRIDLYEDINNLGIGAQGLGGKTTILDIKISTYPTHAASLPVALIPNCTATRHIKFKLTANQVAKLPEVNIDNYPNLDFDLNEYKKINLETITKEQIKKWRIGDTLLLSGKILTGRDATHNRLQKIIEKNGKLPKHINFDNRFIYYVGPVNPVRDEILGPAGPTTANRMDKFSTMMLENTKILGMIGKAERGENTIKKLKKYGAVYLIAVGGAAYLISKAIKKAKIIAFADIGMEALYELEIKDMPVTVAIDSLGQNIHSHINK